MNQTIDNDWVRFKEIFKQEILPIYEKHECDFDFFGIHGTKHIARCIIFCEIMTRFYKSAVKEELDFKGIRIAVSFHDAGREGNGKDLWEKQSAELCLQYLIKKGESERYAHSIANSILKESGDNSILSQILHDADTLDIMRLFANSRSGQERFRIEELFFLSAKDVFIDRLSKEDLAYRKQFVNEAWKFIYYTENESIDFGYPNILDQYIYFIKEVSTDEFPLFSSII